MEAEEEGRKEDNEEWMEAENRRKEGRRGR